MSIFNRQKRKLRSVHSGILLAENKKQSTQQSIVTPELPEYVTFPLYQSEYGTTVPIVAVHDRVLKGQIIARGVGREDLPIHASTSGVVVAIEERSIMHPAADSRSACIVIRCDGDDLWCERRLIERYDTFLPHQLIERIRNHGIVGLGGAGFPTAAKLARARKVETLIINGAECESYVTSDDMLMRERSEQIVAGADILRYILGAQTCLIGIEDNKPEAIKAMQKSVKDYKKMTVIPLPTGYPCGDSKQLIRIMCDVEVPVGAYSVDYGFAVQNVATASAVFESIYFDKPLISRIITLTGGALRNSMNVHALMGTSVADLFYCSGLERKKLHSIVAGGGMMGYVLHNQEVPVIKTTNCLIAATVEECASDIKPVRSCIRCGYCAQVCPVSLLPQQLYSYIAGDDFNRAADYHLMDCIECGACSSVCPSHIPLVQYYRAAKGVLRRKQERQLQSQQSEQRFENRNKRLEQEKLEKEKYRKSVLEKAKVLRSVKSAVLSEKSVLSTIQREKPNSNQNFPEKSKNILVGAKSGKMRLTVVEKQLWRVKNQLKSKSCSAMEEKALQVAIASLEKQVRKISEDLL